MGVILEELASDYYLDQRKECNIMEQSEVLKKIQIAAEQESHEISFRYNRLTAYPLKLENSKICGDLISKAMN